VIVGVLGSLRVFVAKRLRNFADKPTCQNRAKYQLGRFFRVDDE
jgi:hypothetical protein